MIALEFMSKQSKLEGVDSASLRFTVLRLAGIHDMRISGAQERSKNLFPLGSFCSTRGMPGFSKIRCAKRGYSISPPDHLVTRYGFWLSFQVHRTQWFDIHVVFHLIISALIDDHIGLARDPLKSCRDVHRLPDDREIVETLAAYMARHESTRRDPETTC